MTLDSDIARLSRTRPFSLMPREALQLVAFAGEKKRLKAGEKLFSAGVVADAGYFVLSGAVTLVADPATNKPTRRAEAGVLIGETALIAEVDWTFEARAVENAVVLRIPRETFRRVLLEFPVTAANIRQAYAARTRRLVAELDATRARWLDAASAPPA